QSPQHDDARGQDDEDQDFPHDVHCRSGQDSKIALLCYHYGMLVAVLCGATAIGKSALALELAKANGFEILSADSRQIYRRLEIGTGAPTSAEKASVPHHLTEFADPAVTFSPREDPANVHRLLDARPGTRFLLVGGTGLYLK